MSRRRKGRRQKRGGRVTAKPPIRPTVAPRPHRSEADANPFAELFLDALDRDHPGPLLMLGSYTLGALVDAPVDRLVDGLTQHRTRVAGAVLASLSVLVPGQTQSDRCAAALTGEPRLPPWVSELAAARVERIVQVQDVLLGPRLVLLGIRWPSGNALTVGVTVSPNFGGVVNDVDVWRADIDQLLDVATWNDSDHTIDVVDPARARASLEEPLRSGASIDRCFEPTWSRLEPLVAWVVSLLPSGGAVADPPEWSEEDTRHVVAGFLRSPYAAAIDRAEHDLVEAIVEFGTTDDHCDPFRWSSERVGDFLRWWAPDNLREPAERLPTVLEAYIRWAHRLLGVRTDWTATSLHTVDRLAPTYRALVNEMAS